MYASRITRRHLNVQGHRACLLESGEGPPVVILASQFVLALSYRPLMERLRRSFRVIAVEMPGSGSGSRLDRPWNCEDYARWVPAFLEALDLDRTTLVGHSNSGAVALMAASIQPERIACVVLADSVGGDTAGSVARILWSRFLDSFLELRLSVSGWHHLIFNAVVHSRNFFHQIRQAARGDILDYAWRVRVPVLLAWGAQDQTMPMRCAEAFAARLPRGQLYISKPGSHDWLITNAAEFSAVLAEFVENTGSEGQCITTAVRSSRPRGRPSH